MVQEITLSFDEASGLAMTLPRLLTAALRRRFADKTMRHVYPVRGYRVECSSDQRHVLLTLSCGNGFDIVFGLDINMLPTFTRDLADARSHLEIQQPFRPN